MPSSTSKRITYPVGSDLYAATPAFATLAATTDQAIRESEAATLSAARTVITTIADGVESRVENMIAASALGGMNEEQTDAAVSRVLSSEAWRSRQSAVTHVADFGAVGDGVTDDTAAIQAAMDAGGRVEFSKRTYLISGTLYVPSGVHLAGNGAKLVSSKAINALFSIDGSPEAAEVNLVGTYNRTDTTLKTETPHGLEVGEAFRLVGQRCAGSMDAPPDDRLGMSTSGNPYPWFGEYLKVRKVISPTEFTTSTGLIFNGYRPDKLQEKMEGARERTTLNKMRWARDITIEGFRIDLRCAYTIRANYAMDCTFRDIRDVRRSDSGYFLLTTGCFRCLATECHSEWPTDHPDGVEMYARNTFKLMSSQSVRIDRCTADGGSQIVDMTYISGALIPSIACSVTNCTFWGYDKNAMTSHPGTWGAVVEGNDFRAGNTRAAEPPSGIAIRSPYSVVRNNVVHGRPRMGSSATSGLGNYGIAAFDGGGHHVQIIGNQIMGFDRGVAIMDGNEPAERHIAFYTQIATNQIFDCVYGIALWRGRSMTFSLGLQISDNQITSTLAGSIAVCIDEAGVAPRGVTLTSNHIRLTSSTSLAFQLGASQYPVLIGNTVTGSVKGIYSSTADAVGLKFLSNTLTTTSGVTVYHNV